MKSFIQTFMITFFVLDRINSQNLNDYKVFFYWLVYVKKLMVFFFLAKKVFKYEKWFFFVAKSASFFIKNHLNVCWPEVFCIKLFLTKQTSHFEQIVNVVNANVFVSIATVFCSHVHVLFVCLCTWSGILCALSLIAGF